MLKVRATPVLETGAGATVEVHADSYRYDPEHASTPAERFKQQLVVTTSDGGEHRFGLVAHRNDDGDWVTGHTIEIEPVPDVVSDETVQDEQDQALQDAFEETQAEERRRAEEFRALIIEAATTRNWTAPQLLADFAAWRDSDIGFNEASFVVLADYLEHLQHTR